MRSSSYITLFAASVLAQESATVFNLFPFDSTLTVVGTASSATTYKNSCPSDKAGITALPSDLRPTPAPTAKARLRRQADSSSDADDVTFCEPYTLIQGASTYEFHMTDPSPGAWTVDVGCSWQGAFTTADLSCTANQGGYVATGTNLGFASTVIKHSDIDSMGEMQTVAVVRASGGSSATPTASHSGTGAAAPTKSGSGTGAAAASTGLAPAGPLPTGAMALVGGAAGIFAAALAL